MATVTIKPFTGPPAVCEKCKGQRFSPLHWPNRDGTTELTYCCAGCGRVYEPVPIDVMANLRKAFEDSDFLNTLAASIFSSSMQTIMQQAADEEAQQYAERARAGDMVDAFAYAAQAVKAFQEEITEDVVVKPHRDPHRRENWRAMERKHGRRHAGKKR